MNLRTLAAVASLATAVSALGCSDMPGSQESDIREDTSRAPIVVWVPVRFTRNDVGDVGYFFSSSWIPLTNVKKQKADGYAWAAWNSSSATAIAEQIGPDKPGAGYATAWFVLQIPYDTDGEIAYSLARVKLHSEFIATEIASTVARTYSPLRARRGSDQPCLSITTGGSLDGKLKSLALPFEDEGFTERDWKIGDKDASGVPIERVIVGSLRFSATCWPENVEGDTHVSAGVAGGAGPVSGFVMMDQSSGQLSSDWATLYQNLVENEKGEVSVGELFSTSATVLRAHEVAKYDQAARAFHDAFVAGAEKYYEDYLASLQYGGGSW